MPVEVAMRTGGGTLVLWAAVAAVGFVGPACSAESGDGEPATGGTGAGGTGAAGAAGTSAGESANSAFVGSWVGHDRVLEGTCAGGESATEFPFSVRAEGARLVLETDGCALTLNVSGTVATLDPAPQDCAKPGGALSFESYRLELDGAGRASVTSSAILTVSGATPFECHADVRMNATRSSG